MKFSQKQKRVIQELLPGHANGASPEYIANSIDLMFRTKEVLTNAMAIAKFPFQILNRIYIKIRKSNHPVYLSVIRKKTEKYYL